MHKLVAAAKETGYLEDFPRTINEDEAAQLPPGRVLYLLTGSQGEPRAALPRIAAGQHRGVSLGQGDAVIFSSRIIPGNELAIFELHNRLAALGVEVLTEQDHFVHVSGHPCRDELAEMYRWTRPRIAVPVHGELRHMSEHARLARALQVPEAVVVENGHMLRLAPGKAMIVDEVPSGRVHLDGRVLVEEGAGLARSRRALGFAGFIAITLVLDGRGRVATAPAVIIDGIPEPVARGDTRCRCGSREASQKGRRGGAKGECPPRRTPRAPTAWGKKPRDARRGVWL